MKKKDLSIIIAHYLPLDNEKLNPLIKTLEFINNQKNTIHIFSETDYPYIIENNNMVNLVQKNLSNNTSVII